MALENLGDRWQRQRRHAGRLVGVQDLVQNVGTHAVEPHDLAVHQRRGALNEGVDVSAELQGFQGRLEPQTTAQRVRKRRNKGEGGRGAEDARARARQAAPCTMDARADVGNPLPLPPGQSRPGRET